ncbi:leucine-rich repeat-containing protein 40-like [Hylaeus volcanicus]|uniref:leucine-rich repeat-containing protein 40-like n=1 Tax=Hylaeus volcanicus TaxID=313075 RepID=UPI0023B81AA8|nr:leucine-rich repeat-containing protein 40-like [Hylaeus volcanicus]
MLLHTNIRNPMFVIEYEYLLDKLTNEDTYRNHTTPCMVNNTLCVCLSASNIMQYISINEKMELYNLVKICISGHNINSIDIDLELPNLKEFDISFNCFEEFPNSNIVKSVKILNISSNNIQSIHVHGVLYTLEELDVSWNCLTNCLSSIKTFTTFTPNIYKLKMHNNPFKDVTDPQFVEYVMRIYLPNLQSINNCECESHNLSENYFPCAFNMCQLKKRNKLIYLKQNTEKSGKKAALIKEKQIEHAKYIHISQNLFLVLDVLKNALKVQELCAACCPLTIFPIIKPLKHLIKLNLGSNFISVLDDFNQENLPSLKYLDLTNNLITSLESMGSFHTLQEFYCGSNKIKNLTQIDNVKTWQMLHVIDLSNNPIITDALYKKFIIFHLHNIKVRKIIYFKFLWVCFL